MKKTPSLFKRDYDHTRQVYDELVPGSEWVQRGEGQATLKIDGTCCMIADGTLYKRYDRKLHAGAARRRRKGDTGPWAPEDFKPAPHGFIPCEAEPDLGSGHWPGWLPVDRHASEDRWHVEAFTGQEDLPDGTYELIGPSIQGNPYRLERHELVRHGATTLEGVPTSFAELEAWFAQHPIEGVVWHHPDGRRVKIKRRDFGLSWP